MLRSVAQRFKVSGFGQPRNRSEYTAEELAEVRSTAKLGFRAVGQFGLDRDDESLPSQLRPGARQKSYKFLE